MRRIEHSPSSGRIRLTVPLVAATGLAVLALALPALAAAATEHTLEVDIAGSGEGAVGCKVNSGPIEECEAEYPEGTDVTVIAESEVGTEFVEWKGDCDSTVGEECKVEIDADKAVEVVFDLEEFELTIETEGSGEGVVECQVEAEPYEPCPESETYPYGTEVSLFAEAEEGSEFAEWGGDCAGVEVECALTVEEPLSVTATFEPEPPFALTINLAGSGEGEVECEVEEGPLEACEAEYEEGTEVNLVAEPDPGSEFIEWEGECDSVAGNECEVEMDADKTVEAIFDLESAPEFELEITTAGSGEGEVECEVEEGPLEPCEAEYEEGTELALVAVAEAGSEFTGFSAGTGSAAACTTSPCTFTITANSSVTATFEEEEPTPEFDLTIVKAGTGSGSVTCDGGACAASYPEGEELTLAATAASGSTFSGWSGAGCSGTGSCAVTIEEDTTVTATFTANPAPPTPTCATDPSLCPPPPPVLEGKAKAAATAKVKGGKAQLKLTCSGGPCKGTLKLTAKVKQGTKTKNLTIGKASFNIASGATTTLKVKLSGPAKTELGKGKVLKAKVGGSGVVASTVKLKPAKKAT